MARTTLKEVKSTRTASGRTVRDFMTSNPHSIGKDQTLAAAHKVMRTNRIRHLPVLDGGKLVGLVSDRDLHLVETLRDVDPEVVTIDDAMTEEPFAVGPNTPIEVIARKMADTKLGSAVVVERGKTIGIFTTIDALRALVDIVTRKHSLPG